MKKAFFIFSILAAFLSFKTYSNDAKRISMEFNDINAKTAIEVVKDLTGITIIGAELLASKSITLKANNKTWPEVVRMIVNSAALSVTIEGREVIIK